MSPVAADLSDALAAAGVLVVGGDVADAGVESYGVVVGPDPVEFALKLIGVADFSGVPFVFDVPEEGLDQAWSSRARQSTAWGARSVTTSWIHSEPSEETWVSWAERVSPSKSKKSRNVAAVRFFTAHTSAPVSWSTTHSRLPPALTVGNLIDPDLGQPGQLGWVEDL